MSARPLLHARGVGKRFGGLQALAAVDLEIREGEICGVIGPNGAGKSTLFNVLAGVFGPTEGSVEFDGADVTGLPSHAVACRGVARAFQLVNLFESMSVRENVLLGAHRHQRIGLLQAVTHRFGYLEQTRGAQERAQRAIDLVGIAHLQDAPVSTLGYGQQRLVSAARALAAWPRLLLLDEPGAGLSESEIEILADAVRRARESGVTVLLIEHNVGFVMRLCEHVAVLHFGRKIADGDPGRVRADPAVAEAYLGH